METTRWVAFRDRLRDWRKLLRREGAYTAEVAALCGVVFARPVLASYGQSPETLIAWGADGRDVLLFGLLVVLVPVLVLVVPLSLLALVGRRTRLAGHVAALAVLAVLAGVQTLRINTELGDRVVWGAAVVLASALVAARSRFEIARVFLRYAGLASAVFLVQFLAFSPSASLIFGGFSASVDPEATAAVGEAVGEDGPPVVVIMLDALPTASLMDGEGNIDADVYPNLAGLASEGTWYQNHTTVAQETLYAVPAALSGELPEPGTPPVASKYSHNLFTLLGGAYEMQVTEQVTALCPTSLCPDARSGGLRPLLGDARDLWGDSLEEPPPSTLGLPGAFGSRHDDFWRWIEERDLSSGGQPSLYFYHLLMPHDPWSWLPGSVRYHGSMPADGQYAGHWGQFGSDVGLQRHVLQTQMVDEMIGWFFNRLREAGLYDDALIVVTADHGYAFEPEAPVRGVAESQVDQIMWTPLIVKGPGQQEAVVDRSNVQNVDLLPIVADELGLDLREDLGWEVDGIVPTAEPRSSPDKPLLDWAWGELHPDDGEDLLVVDGREGFERVQDADLIEGSGPLAAWQRTEHGHLVGAEVAELEVGEHRDATLELDDLGRFDQVDVDVPLGLELRGRAWLTEEDAVVVALDGTVAAVIRPTPTGYGVAAVRGLLWPGAFVEGRNELTAYGVSGAGDDAVLHPLEVAPTGQ